jgi:nicotinamide-nucleotide adenylyltransferase
MALLIGRFQPFHKGHLLIIKKILEEADELIIVIGSSQYSATKENPFSAAEREEMIRRALKTEGVSGFQVYKIPDINDDDLYPGHVRRLVPKFDRVYSGNDLVQHLFKASGKDVRKINLIKGTEYSGTEIRKRMIKDRKWEQLVPEAVLEYLKEIKGVERVKELWRGYE